MPLAFITVEPETNPRSIGLPVVEVVRIDPLQLVRCHPRHTDIMVDHELGQSLTINQHDFIIDRCDIIDRIAREFGCRNKYPTFRTLKSAF